MIGKPRSWSSTFVSIFMVIATMIGCEYSCNRIFSNDEPISELKIESASEVNVDDTRKSKIDSLARLEQQLVSKYGSNCRLDTLNLNFSIEFDELIEDNAVLVRMNQLTVHDIYNEDTAIFARLNNDWLSNNDKIFSGTSKPHLELRLSISDDMSKQLKNLTMNSSEIDLTHWLSNRSEKKLIGDGFLAIKVNRIRKIDFILGIDKFENEDDTTYEIDFQSGNAFFVEGVLINIHSLP